MSAPRRAQAEPEFTWTSPSDDQCVLADTWREDGSVGAVTRPIPTTRFKAVALCASPLQRVLGQRGTAACLVCRSVGYNWALREPIEGD